MWKRHAFTGAAAGLLVATVAGLAASWVVGGRLVAPVAPIALGPGSLPMPASLDVEPIALDSASGATLAGWHVRAEASRGVVVLLHGVRGTRLAMVERARWLRDAGFSSVLIDFQAHGESPGERITLGHLERHDARAAVDFARAEHPGKRVGVIGVSLGGAAALLASPLGVDALVVESVYPDVASAVRNRVRARMGALAALPAALLLAQLGPRLGVAPAQLRPIDRVADAGCPLLVLSGRADRHTTEAETRALFERAREPKELWLVDGAGHVDLHAAAPSEYEARVLRFLTRHL